jgi:hypothetical protein
MTRTRLGLLGLCAMVFGLMAFSASAQASAGAKWLILESAGVLWSEAKVNEGKASVLLEAETTGVLHTKIAGVAVLFECKKLAAEKAFLLANGSIGESAGNVKGSKVKFSECITKLNGVTSAACEPNAGGTQKGVIVTNAGHALLVLHELAGGVKDDLVSILPDNVIKEGKEVASKTFATIEMSELCSIGEKVPVLGKATLKDCENLALTHLVKHLTEIGPLTELWTISETAEHVATILGSGWASLSGAGAGKLFSGDPN